ncbi:amino acid adenylation domain-containing protein [Streptomyces decoyicus]|uniref:non-ribosomal peptide synthetase n=1 Tax=Streptomyces decoyicus TaxID=249567 RepID=UPI00362EEA5C
MKTQSALEDVLPLAPLQEGFLFHALYDGQAPDIYNVQLVLRIEGAVDTAVLRKSVGALLTRHANLRAGFRTRKNGQPIQVIHRHVPVPLTEIELAATEETEREAELERWLAADRAERFDLARPPLLRLTLVRLGDQQHCLALTSHHILLDGWSTPLLLDELFTLYAQQGSPAGLPALTPYRDYLGWLGKQDLGQAERAWQQALSGLDGPTRVADTAERTPALPERVTRELSEEFTAELTAAARGRRLTMNSVLQGAWAVVLAQLTGRDDVVFGTTVSTRPAELPGSEAMIGLFINTIPVRARLAQERSFLENLARFQEEQSALLPHQYLGLGRIQQLAGAGELFDTTTVFENYPVGAGDDDAPVAGLRLTEADGRDATHYALNLVGDQLGGRLTLRLDYRADLFGRETAEAVVARVHRLLASVVTEPDVPLGRIDLTDPGERARLGAWNDTAHEVPATTPLALFEAQCARTPQATAVVFEDTALTYAELDERANRLAHLLIARGARPEQLVALALPRSADMVVALLGVLKSGAAYLPLDPGHPEDRIAFTLADAAPGLVITATESAAVTAGAGIPQLVLDAAGTQEALAAQPATAPVRPGILPSRPAYAIYTSGSTGTPKGVLVEHGALVNHMSWMADAFPLSAQDTVLARTALTFDASVWEIWLPLLTGATLCVAPESLSRDPERLLAYIRQHGVTVAQFVPSLLAVVAGAVRDDEALPLQRIFVGGEPLAPALAARTAESWGVSVTNLYGPTESTVQITTHTFAPDADTGAVPVGRPVWNTRLHVLDSALKPVPVGVPGELYVAGDQLARGYLRRTDLTAGRFVADPFGAPGTRMYRTGDVVKRRADGLLEFAGRADDQVKIRGLRIEPGEIEAVVGSHPLVRQAAVVVREDRPGDQRIVAYVVPAEDAGTAPAGLREHAARTLPDYMVPAAFVPLDALPLTPNGKLDRRALPAPDLGSTTASRRPRDPREEILCGLFAEVLGVDRVGAEDNFFELGGHSLLAMRLISRVRTVLGVEPAVRDLFETPTAAGLAGRLDHVAGARAALVPVERPERVPLSFAQRRLWFLHQLEGPSATYNVPMPLRLTGSLNAEALREAIHDLTDRHESLRTVFPHTDGAPYQHVLHGDAARPVIDIVPVNEADLDTAVDQAISHTFDLTKDVPLRAWVFTLTDDEHLVLLLAHHIVSDGASLAPLAHDLSTAYTARCEGAAPHWTPLPVQYADYTLWQREVLGDESDPDSVISRQIDYWHSTLTGLPEQLELPADRPRPAVASHQGDSVEMELDAEVHRGMVRLAREHQVSVFMVVQAGIAALLTRLGAGTDIPIGSPIAGRTDDALEDLVGFFVNTLVLRTDTSGDPTFAELLGRVRETDLAAYAHQDVPFERLVEIVNPTRSLSHHPLFQVILTFQNSSDLELDLAGLAVREHALDAASAKFDLSFALEEQLDGSGVPSGMRGSVEFATDLFDRQTAESIAAWLERLLRNAVEDASRPIGELDVLTAQEHELLLNGWNDTARDVSDATLAELFEAQVARTPDAAALEHDGTQLTYSELNARANQLAHHLISRNVGPEQIVALALPRTIDVVVAILAVAKTGAAYLPVDPDYPADRIAYLFSDARPTLLITDKTTATGLPETGVPTLTTDQLRTAGLPVTDPTNADRLGEAKTSHPVFVIYTSGSTGRPKGVVVEHRSLNLYLRWAHAAYPAMSGRTLVHSPVSFDLTVTGLLGPLTLGGCAHLVELDEGTAPDLDQAPTFVKATPSHLTLLKNLPPHISPTEQLVLGGEALLGEALDEWRRDHPDTTVINEYGPTETTVGCTQYRIEPGQPAPTGTITIGHPIWNTQIHILDAHLQPVPPNVTGELYIAGNLLARGYLHRPDLTATRFTANPHGAPGTRMYRTGDLARRRPDGQLEFAGRIDTQVKVRGYRIELGEIEATLTHHPHVRQAAVIVREDQPGDQRIVAYVIPTDDHSPTATELRDHAAQSLPDYMVPAAVVTLDVLPLTPNGKLDHKALPAPQFSAAATTRGPRNTHEELLCHAFAQTLGVEHIGIDDNFFDLGGHSLLATRLTSRIRTTLNTELTVRDLFEAPTVATLATRLHHTTGARTPLTPRPRPDHIPLSPAQHRLWFLHQLEGPSATYNVPMVLRLTGGLDTAALRDAIHDLTDRHETLRTVFPEYDGTPYQHVLHGDDARPVIDIVPVNEDDLDTAVSQAVTHTFDLTNDVPLRAWVFTTGADRHTLLILAHHIASDGWSMGPLAQDLATAYAARCDGTAPQWAPLPVQYADYALWQSEVLGDESDPQSLISRQIDYWRTTLAALPDHLELPTDRPRPAIAGHHGGSVPIAWDAELHHGITRLAREHQASVFMVVQTALATLLTRLGAGTDIPLGSPIAGRTDDALDNLVGFFINTLVLRTDTSGNPTFTELLARVRETDLAAYTHQDVPFERLVELLNPTRSLAHNPLFQVVLGLESASDGEFAMRGLSAESAGVDTGVAKVDLAVNLLEVFGEGGEAVGMRGVVEFATDLFDRRTAESIALRLERLLRTAVEDASRPIAELDILSVEERELLLHGWNDTARDVPEATLPALFEAQVARTPDAPALEHEGTRLSYTELNTHANQLAHHLIAQGAGPEKYVAVALPRGIELTVAILAIVKAGAAYVPLDPDYPADRLTYMLDDARPTLLVTDKHTAAGLPDTALTTVILDTDTDADADTETDSGSGSGRQPATNPDNSHRTTPLLTTHPAYLIYTSGSTGRPKGVIVSHSGVANLSAHQTDRLGAGPGCRVSQLVSPSFDVSVAELCMGLLSGACLVLPPRSLAGEELAEFLAERAITHAHLPASLLVGMPRRELPSLASLMVGAEACPPDVTAFWSAGRRMVNAYGPTEATVDTCFAVCGPEQGAGPTPIGRPVFNTRLYVLDSALRPVPAGVPGELYISGPGLARGYLGRPELTATRFVADPFSAGGGRMYRTGDLVRRRADGQLEFIGRIDHQVKVRGFRIELGEIENVLTAQRAVEQVAVIVREDRPGDRRIVAYVVPAGANGAEPSGAELRSRVAEVLPEYMVPSAFVALDALPLTPNGKLDRTALPAPELSGATDGRGPRDAHEEKLCAIFAEVLGAERVGIDDNFFDLGGHSLLATRLTSRIRGEFGIELTVREVFGAPTVAGLARLTGGGAEDAGQDDGLGVLLPLRASGAGTPLFCAHPSVPLSWCYTGLLGVLAADTPVYGLQSRGLAGDAALPETFAEMAEDYTAQIRRVQPAGPYRLLGYSLGGNIVHAIATRLQELGEEVELLAVLDAYPGGDIEAVPLDDGQVLARFHADLGQGNGEGYNEVRQREQVIDSLRTGLPGNFTEEQLARILDAMINGVGNNSRYEPGTFKGDMLLFTTTVGRADPAAMPEAWSRVVAGGIENHRIACPHDDLLKGEPLRAVGAVLSGRMRELDARGALLTGGGAA